MKYGLIITVLLLVLASIHVLMLASTDEDHLIDVVYTRDSFITVDNTSKGPMYNLTYGEITEAGIRNIMRYLKANKAPTSTFIDLGSGNGRSLVYATKNGFRKAKGVEIVEERHQYALHAIERLPKYKNSIQLVHGDMFQRPPAFFPPASTIFVSNLLFPPETNGSLFRFLSENTPKDVTLVVSAVPANLHSFELVTSIEVPMSWASTTKCYVLRKSHPPG